MVISDWEVDFQGLAYMDVSQFVLSIFQLVDKWTDSLDPSSYTAFLDEMYPNLVCEAPKKVRVAAPTSDDRQSFVFLPLLPKAPSKDPSSILAVEIFPLHLPLLLPSFLY